MRPSVLAFLFVPAAIHSQSTGLTSEIARRANEIAPKVVSWRRDIHQHPELSWQETRTAGIVAAHLKALGLEVQTGVGGTGVIGILRGARPGPVVALRADMDALPVTEMVDLPFKSTVRAQYNGQEVGVMHACGHDNHVAILMGTAEVLANMKSRLPGTVKFLFQSAEESPPGGALRLIEAGVMENPKVDAVFGLHVGPGPVGSVGYRAGPSSASGDNFRIVVRGKQTHGAIPWAGVDPIVIGSQIVLGLQTIMSRQVDLSSANAILTVGTFNAGNRTNIIPDTAVLTGTVRTFDEAVRKEIHARIRKTAESIAQSAGATAQVDIELGYPVLSNDAALTTRMVPTLVRTVGAENVGESPRTTTSEDFSRYAQKAPGLFIGLGVTSPTKDWRTAATNHSPLFEADEAALPIGVKLLSNLAVDYLTASR